MIRAKFNQARCDNCGSWHFALQLDDNLNIIELKCCRCGRIEKVRHLKPVTLIEQKEGEKENVKS